jgi:hypothetical protein
MVRFRKLTLKSPERVVKKSSVTTVATVRGFFEFKTVNSSNGQVKLRRLVRGRGEKLARRARWTRSGEAATKCLVSSSMPNAGGKRKGASRGGRSGTLWSKS